MRKDGSVVLVANINPTGDSALLQPGRNYAFTEYRGKVFLSATRPDIGKELFKVAKAGDVVLAADVNPVASSGVSGLTRYHGDLYFRALAEAAIGVELYKLAPARSGSARRPPDQGR